jgi:hypothetical protein
MDPEVKIIENFMSAEDCKYYIDTYIDKLERAVMFTNVDNKINTFITDRQTSTHYTIPLNEPISCSLRSKIADLLQVDIKNIERVLLARYEK